VLISAESAVLGELWELAEMRHRDPSAALQRTNDLLLGIESKSRERALGQWVVGLAFHELGQLGAAVRSFRASVSLSRRYGWSDCEALSRASMAISVLSLGDASAAEREIVEATSLASGPIRGVVAMLHGLVQQRTGRLD
jgi:hypothetical protein